MLWRPHWPVAHEIAKKQQSGFGGMLSFEIKNGLSGVKNFIDNLNILSLAGSLGGFESLVGHPYTMTHAALSGEQKKEIGIKEKDWDDGTNKAVDKHYGSKYNKELTDGCHAFLEKTIPNGKERVEKVVQTLY